MVTCRDRNMVSLFGIAATLVVCATAAPGDYTYIPSLTYNNISASAWHAMPLCKGYKIEDATIDELQEFMTIGNLTTVQLVTCYMQRYYQTNQYIK
jgi:amidase